MIDKAYFIKKNTKKSRNKGLKELYNGFQYSVDENCLGIKKIKL
jgi:hypothetical protein